MLSSSVSFTKKINDNVSLIIMAIALCLLPIFKGGNFPGVMPLFIFFSGIIFIVSISEFSYERDKYWLIVWGVFTCAILCHAFLYPFFFTNDRFFVERLGSAIGTELNSRGLSKIRMVEVWSFFTSMWLFAWRVSLFELKQLSVLLLFFFLLSFFQALFGVIHFISGASTVLGLWVKEFYLGDATGTFVNRNHFAGMLAISSPLVLTNLLMQKPLILVSLSKNYRAMLAFVYLMVLVLALISSHSRMGMVAAIFGLIICYSLLGNSRNHSEQKSSRFKLFGVVAFLCLFAIWFGFDDILQRYADLGDGDSRFDVWRSMFTKVPFNVWLFGAGPGSFESIFQIIKPSSFSVRFIYAHNDYLEFVFEFGMLFSLMIVVAVLCWMKHFYSKDWNYLKAGIYGSFAAVGLHSLVDFNLQVPGSALCFWFAVGLLANPAIVKKSEEQYVRSVSSQKKRKQSQSRFPKSRREWLNFLRSD